MQPTNHNSICRGCEKPLLSENRSIADGCPCNSERGINHGLVPPEVCTCKICDPAQQGCSRAKPTETAFATTEFEARESDSSALQRIAKEAAEVDRKYGELLGIIDEEVKRLEERRQIFCAGTPRERLRRILEDTHQSEVDAIEGCKRFRDDCVNWLRALSIVIAGVGNAATHNEKSARCRMAVETVESAIVALREREFGNHGWRFWREDVFRNDYPTREYVRRIHELEEKIRELSCQNPVPVN